MSKLALTCTVAVAGAFVANTLDRPTFLPGRLSSAQVVGTFQALRPNAANLFPSDLPLGSKTSRSIGLSVVVAATGLTAVVGSSRRLSRQAAGAIGKFDPAHQVGVTAPLGYFDPVGICEKGDKVGFRRLRAAEIKHGRVAMMACLGSLVQHYLRFPGFENVP
ncbi:unnamed protein product [Polarella glacialis]|uniref:Uncharacterized protein n=1 Tax=Polarella glacialis TaxID=89957 RepID=A0A813GEV4_POLGL|nr:unnamed protein product [Polarella glacialis]